MAQPDWNECVGVGGTSYFVRLALGEFIAQE